MRSSGTPEPTRDGRARTRSVGWSTLHRSLQPRERTTQPGSDGGYSGQRGGEGGQGALATPANAAKTAEQTRGPQARRGEAKVLETAAEPKRDEQGRAQVLRSRNCAKWNSNSIPVATHTGAGAGRHPRAVPKTRRLPRRSAGAREGPRRPAVDPDWPSSDARSSLFLGVPLWW
jgi:hypothetical protein